MTLVVLAGYSSDRNDNAGGLLETSGDAEKDRSQSVDAADTATATLPPGGAIIANWAQAADGSVPTEGSIPGDGLDPLSDLPALAPSLGDGSAATGTDGSGDQTTATTPPGKATTTTAPPTPVPIVTGPAGRSRSTTATGSRWRRSRSW